jgi:penicillin-binding protein 1A
MKLKINNKYLRVSTWLALLVVFSMAFILGFIISVRSGFFGPLPTYSQLEKIEQNNASKILSSEGKLLGLYYYQNRTDTRIEDIPQTLIDALISTEDARFYRHNGFDTRSFFRVMFKSVLLFDRGAGGGSTISQQLAKNLFPRNNFGLISLPVAKVKEIITALRLEKIYSKEKILELYFNTVSFGENTYGIETAALTYFKKKPAELSINESAVLVGLLKANTGYNPRLNREAAFDRRNTVIGQMVKYGYLDEAEANSLKLLPVELHFNKLDHIEGPAPYYREFLRVQVDAILKEINNRKGTDYNLYADGLTIYTTINSSLQNYAEASVNEQLAALQDHLDQQWRNHEPWKKNPSLARMQIEQSIPYQKLKKKGLSNDQILDSLKTPHPTKIFTWQGEKDTVMSSLDSILYHFSILQCGMLAMDARTGNILAWVGGPSYKYFKYDHVLAARQVGSTIKPLVYAAALDYGIKPCDYYKNDSIIYPEFDNWVPQNADQHYGGYYSVQGALINSVNTISVQLLMETGIGRTKQKLQEAGITAKLPEVPSLALGSAEIPLFQMVKAYSVFLNKGSVRQPNFIQRIEDKDGNVIYEQPRSKIGEPVFSEPTVETMLALLVGVADRGTAAGLHSKYGIYSELGGKTGTTQEQTDGWFLGITPDIIVGVWVGGDSPLVHFRNLSTGQGAQTAMPVFANFIQKIQADKTNINLLEGSFNIQDEVYDHLKCADFKESNGIFYFLKKQPDRKEKSETQQEKNIRHKEEEGTKVGKFFRNIFGKKEKK